MPERAEIVKEQCSFRRECGFWLTGATEYEVEWIGVEHRALIHGDGE